MAKAWELHMAHRAPRTAKECEFDYNSPKWNEIVSSAVYNSMVEWRQKMNCFIFSVGFRCEM